MQRLMMLFAGLYVSISIGISYAFGGPLGSIDRAAALPFGFLWILSKFGKPSFRRLPSAVISIIVFVVWQCISALWSSAPDAAQVALFRHLLIAVQMVVLWDVLSDTKQIKWLMQAFVGGGYFVLLQLVNNYRLGNARMGGTRFNALGVQANEAGAILAVAIGFAWMLYLDGHHKYVVWRVLNFIFPAIAIVGIVLTGSRGALVSASFTTAFVIITFARRPVGIPILAAISMGGLTFLLSNPIIQSNLSRLQGVANSAASDGFSGREELWRLAIDAIKSSPIIGIGLGGFRNVTSSISLTAAGSVGIAAHNAFLSVASASGLIGLGFFLNALWQCIKDIRYVHQPYKLGFIAIILGNFATMMGTHSEASLYMWISFILIAAYGYLCRQEAMLKAPVAVGPRQFGAPIRR